MSWRPHLLHWDEVWNYFYEPSVDYGCYAISRRRHTNLQLAENDFLKLVQFLLSSPKAPTDADGETPLLVARSSAQEEVQDAGLLLMSRTLTDTSFPSWWHGIGITSWMWPFMIISADIITAFLCSVGDINSCDSTESIALHCAVRVADSVGA